MAFNWDDYPVISKGDGSAPSGAATPSKFNWDDHPVVGGPSELSSAGRGLAQGASFGLRDEAAGALESPLGGLKEIANKFGAGFSDDDVAKYKAERDASRLLDSKAKAANPKSYLAGELGGAVATSFVPGLGLAEGAGLAGTIGHAAAQGAAYGVGNSQGESIGDLAKDTLVGAGLGGVGGAAGYGAGKLINYGAQKVAGLASKAAPGLENAAENLAVNSTGATGRESQKFADDAGRELLDRKLVRFGDNSKNIADRVGGALDDAHSAIDGSLRTLDEQGATVNVKDIVKNLEEKVEQMRADPSQADTVRKLTNVIDDIKDTGTSEVPVSAAEQTKRGFNKIAGNWMDPEKGAAGKAAYQGYRQAVENAAAEDPGLYGLLMEGKQTHGLLAPIQEAAERRAATVRQSPFGGLGDWAAAAAGAATHHPLLAIPAVIAKKVVAPRIASSLAVTTDMLAKAATAGPEVLGKFAPVIQNAVQRGTQAVAATHFILQQSSPEYREKIKALQDGEGTDAQ
jgi:hypothetical protein